MEIRSYLLLIFLIIGITEVILSIPLILEKVPRNGLYGFRTQKTQSSDEIWYKSNKFIARDLFISGLIVVIGNLILLFINSEMSLRNTTIIGLLTIIIPIIITLYRGFNYLEQL